MVENQATRLFRQIRDYYFKILHTPVTLGRKLSFHKYAILPFLLFRLINSANWIQNFLLFGGLYGHLDIYGELEAILWMLTLDFFYLSDLIFFRPGLQFKIESLLQYSETFMESVGTTDAISRCKTRTLKIFIFNSVLDYFQITTYGITSWGAVDYKTQVYWLFPWKFPELEATYWFLQTATIGLLFFSWSTIICLPSCVAYQVEACVNGINDKLRFRPLESCLSDYRAIWLSSRIASDELDMIQLFNYLHLGVEQTVQSYILFQMIRNGASVREILYLLGDLTSSLSRVAFSFYALTTVVYANKRVWKKFRMYNGERKLVRKTVRSLRPIEMKIGPWACDTNLLLSGMSSFLDYYVVAALWP